MRPKTLKFRYVVLRPVIVENDEDIHTMDSGSDNIGLIYNDPEKKLSFKILDKSQKQDKMQDYIINSNQTLKQGIDQKEYQFKIEE